jgi:predicted ester cyclase
MTEKDLKAIGRHLVEEMNKGKAAALAVLKELYANDVVYHGTDGIDIHGLKNYNKHTADFFDAAPDAHFKIDDVVVEGDRGVWRLTLTFTFTGKLGDIQPTNRRIKIAVAVIDRFAKGKVVEEWEFLDRLGMYQQAGLIPTPKKEK